MSTPFSGLSAGYPAGPRTPEPTAATFPPTATDAQPPSPPRPRLRLKRRAVPHLSAPTQNFLASVAAADVPIPSIEVPDQEDRAPGLLQLQQQQKQQQQQQAKNAQCLFPTDNIDTNFLSVRGRSTFSPPKTPAPDALPSSSPTRYPNWSRMDSVFSSSTESSPERDCGSSSRPSTARSTQTSSSSLFSRFSQLSDDEQHCISPEDEANGKSKTSLGDHFHELRRNSASGSSFGNIVDAGNDDSVTSGQKRHARKAPWTNAMSSHLWATYILYLQDPKVTPFRVGKSCVPPHGVLLRVAREAKRSWKGAKAVAKASASTTITTSTTAATLAVPAASAASAPPATTVSTVSTATGSSAAQADDAASKSGSSTPTAAESTANGTFMEWPFTNAATRAHLRELCRKKAATPGSGARGLQYMSRSPTPFTQTAAIRQRSNNNNHMRVTPGPSSSSSTFATHDMVLSLALSTSETMQPQGPLAQLTRSGSDMAHGFNTAPPFSLDATLASATASGNIVSTAAAQDFSGRLASAIEAEEPSFAERRRLGSPFTARSYGPSSSSSLAAVLGLSTSNSRQPHTVGPRRSLQSPVRLSRSGTQKRRTKHLSQDLRRRPGLASDFFTEPFPDFAASFSGAESHLADFSSSNATHTDELFIPRMENLPALTSSSSAPQLATTSSETSRSLDDFVPDFEQVPSPVLRRLDAPGLLDAAPLQPPARLGSPFSLLPGNNTSFSFPNRFTQPADLDIASVDRPFATVHRTPAKSVPARTNLASRLAYIDQRLRELNNRNENRTRRPDSPL
ncbi:hypothetical protein SCUCBS95973_002224 [Sporothrix curviconia]|uniref:Uncharacterized protein n=1 Tax=Sporothrix curviconia TaxID=1260050 RepID=A0ABP0B574_9PEZI